MTSKSVSKSETKPIACAVVGEDSDSDSGSESKYAKGGGKMAGMSMGGLKNKMMGDSDDEDEDECTEAIGGEITTAAAAAAGTKQIASSIAGSGTVAPRDAIAPPAGETAKPIGAPVAEVAKKEKSAAASEKLFSIVLPIEIVASHSELAADPTKAIFKLTEGQKQALKDVKVQTVGKKTETKYSGNPKKATIHAATINTVSNTFACSASIFTPQVAGNILSGSDKSIVTLAANTQSHYESGVIAHKNANAKSSMVKLMSHLNDEAIGDMFQISKFDKTKCEVKADCQIVTAATNKLNTLLFQKYGNMKVDKSALTVTMDTDDVLHIAKQLGVTVKTLPIVDLENFTATLVRADGRPWNSVEGLVGIIDKTNQREIDVALKLTRQFHLQLKIDYSMPE